MTFVRRLLVMLLIFAVGCDNEPPRDAVPSVVLNALKMEFPKAVDIDWDEKESGYEADFEVGELKHEAFIDNRGNLLKHSREIPFSELSPEIKNKLAEAYLGARKTGIEKIETNVGTFYEVELERFGMNDRVIFDAQARVYEEVTLE